MTSELESHVTLQAGTEKNFGVVFAVVFGLVGLFPLLTTGGVRVWALLIAAIFLALAYIKPEVLVVPNRWWFKFGLLLGAIVAPLVMALVFFVAVLPTGLIVRLSGKDLLRQKIDPSAKSYWITRDQPPGTMKDQF